MSIKNKSKAHPGEVCQFPVENKSILFTMENINPILDFVTVTPITENKRIMSTQSEENNE